MPDTAVLVASFHALKHWHVVTQSTAANFFFLSVFVLYNNNDSV